MIFKGQSISRKKTQKGLRSLIELAPGVEGNEEKMLASQEVEEEQSRVMLKTPPQHS